MTENWEHIPTPAPHWTERHARTDWSAEQARERLTIAKQRLDEGFGEGESVDGARNAFLRWALALAPNDLDEALTRLTAAEAERDQLDAEARRTAAEDVGEYFRQLAVIDRLKTAVRREHERGDRLEAWMERIGEQWYDRWEQAEQGRKQAEAERDRAQGWAKRWKRYTIHFRKGLRHADRAIVGLAGDFIQAVDDERTAEQDRDALRARAERAEAFLHRIEEEHGLVTGTYHQGGTYEYCVGCSKIWPRPVDISDENECLSCIARAYFQEPPARTGEESNWAIGAKTGTIPDQG